MSSLIELLTKKEMAECTAFDDDNYYYLDDLCFAQY